MTFLSSLLTWANVPFVVAFGVAVTFFLLQITGLLGLIMGGGDHDGEHEVDADHDVDADADHDVDTDADHDADADQDHDADADQDHDADQENQAAHAGAGIGRGVLTGLGVGTMPLGVVWQVFMICFGFAGIGVNSVYLDRFGALPAHTLAWTLPIAALFGFAVNHGLSRLFARIVVPPAKASTSRKDLVGRTGVVISSKVNHDFGEVRTVDKSGDTLRLIVKTLDQDEVIEEGREVVFVEYDAAKDTLLVTAFDDDAPSPRPRGRTASGTPPPRRVTRAGTKVRVAEPPAPPGSAEEEAIAEDEASAARPDGRSKAAS